ncbi:hypothetical protein [Corynebacterium sp. A21]|uniref:hypothetical protein n=1 Tax=Corynebacterium sp. A21 TaxID=3457318 RepID=UPI003FD20A52
MALNLSINLNDASFGDLVALVDAARSAGMDPHDQINFDGQTLSLEVDVDAFFPSFADRGGVEEIDTETEPEPEIIEDTAEDFFGPHRRSRNPWEGGRSPLDFVDTSGIGDAAIRSVIDILTGRQEPPKGPRR